MTESSTNATTESRKIYVVRHGQRVDFCDPDWKLTAERPDDPELSATGLAQAECLADKLAGENISHIFASHFIRAIQTAAPLACKCNISLKIEHGLGEFLNPEWSDETPEVLSPEARCELYPQIDRDYESLVVPEYPETLAACWDRVARTARMLTKTFRGGLMVVGHGVSVCGVAQTLLNGPDRPKPALCGVTTLIERDGIWSIAVDDDVSYLGGLVTPDP